MVSVIEEKREREGRRLQQHHYQHHYNDYLQLESSAYSLFVLAIRSPQKAEMPSEIRSCHKFRPKQRH
jgi:hypothetical protein